MKNSSGIVWILLFAFGVACKDKEPARKKHELEIFKPGSFFYLDQVQNKQVMQIRDAADDKRYASYLIGFLDSNYVPDPQQPKKEEERMNYYRFHMQDKWRAVLNGDSLIPVFYQPATQMDKRLNTGVIVFEIPEGMRPDTLLFRDAEDGWNNMMISLKQHKLIQ
jgi:hypothetical protein